MSQSESEMLNDFYARIGEQVDYKTKKRRIQAHENEKWEDAAVEHSRINVSLELVS